MEYGNNLKRELDAYYASLRRKAEEQPKYYRRILDTDENYIIALNKYKSEKFEYAKCKYSGDEPAAKMHADAIKIAKNNLKKAIENIGVKKDYLLPKYKCEKCNDTGRLADGSKCDCYKSALKTVIFETLELKDRKFADFSEVAYTDKNQLEKFYSKAKIYCDKFSPEKSKSLLICGSVGTGKSYLTECIYSSVNQKGFNALFLTACEINNLFLKYHTAPIEEKSFYLDLLSSCDLLIIDDLGCEPIMKNVTVEYLGMLLSERAAKPLPTIITTNLTQDMLFNRYGERILSRLNDKRRSVTLEIRGEDLRRLK